ncbi:HEXXH motif-containing putative peptide modification protein [Pseudoalteromonas sp. MMG012]|uniref:HEXXH motif-containing putative peptide modification protein n=1 Tax=Pseudoalteromonas sp. MMG012 TaxID=2822686 RepID=UPI001B39F9FD|nr:HEXXH motif-containing putative peptide modification protein [Pseudoalteromonas sp. MMG012]MBQ4851220.1 hypothetical protein [Pseudoalteromonas sp. MMG012]
MLNFSCLSNPYEGDFVNLSKSISDAFVWNTIQKEALKQPEYFPNLQHTKTGSDIIGMRPEMGPLRLAQMKNELKDLSDEWYTSQLAIVAYLSGLMTSLNICCDASLKPLTLCGKNYYGKEVKITSNLSNEIIVAIDGECTDTLIAKKLDNQSIVWVNSNAQKSFINLGSLKSAPLVKAVWLKDWNYGEEPAYCDDSTHEILVERVEHGYRFLESHFPEFYLWSIALIHEIIPMDHTKNKGIKSQSYAFWPNQIHLKGHNNLLLILDVIIHENSHMYFNIVELTTPLFISKTPEIYSPLKKVKRPMKMVLLAFHALGNILLLYKKIYQKNLYSDQALLTHYIKHNDHLVKSLWEQLERYKDEYFTLAGHQIYQPLCDQLTSMGVDLNEYN